MRRIPAVFAFLLLSLPATLSAQSLPSALQLKPPTLILSGVNFELEVTAVDSAGKRLDDYSGDVTLKGADRVAMGQAVTGGLRISGGTLKISDAMIRESGTQVITVESSDLTGTATVRIVPGWFSILPPLVAILLALLIRQVVISLFAGIYVGAVILFDYDFFGGIFRVLDIFVVKGLSDVSHIQIVLFSMMFGGMVGVISKNGGTVGIANLITRYAKTPRGGQLASWAMAFVMFFDDYANVLVRGNLMRPITDKLRVSREKLSFIVDAGAATVASIFIVSTWIGYEVGLIADGLKMINSAEEPYAVFLQTIPYRFYPIFTLILVFLIGWMDRDFGPMLTAERRARTTGETLRPGSHPAVDLTESTGSISVSVTGRWYNGLIPILTILFVALTGLYSTGTSALEAEGRFTYSITDIISKSDSYAALMWASLSGCLVAILLTVGQRIMKVTDTLDEWFNGVKSMLLAMIILVLAWSIGAVTEDVQTASFLVQVLRGTIEPHWLPVLVFLIAAIISFATGTSWGTMAIMMPLVIPLANTLGVDAGLQGADLQIILHGVISSVLAGAVFGDHCSPISDTTILSSMASAVDHIDHVKTQMPYALLAAFVGMIIGDIPTAYGFSPWFSILIGTGFMITFLLIVGKKVEPYAMGGQT